MNILFALACILVQLSAMQPEIEPYALTHINQTSLIKTIIHFATDQSDDAPKFENFKTLIKFRHVSKLWKKLCDQEYATQLLHEKHIVAAHSESDHSSISWHKAINSYPGEQDIQDMRAYLSCAVQRNLLILLHDTWKNNKAQLTEKWYYFNPKSWWDKKKDDWNREHNKIYAITWSIYMNAKESEELLRLLFIDDELFKEQLAEALENKKYFDAYKPSYVE